MAACGGDGFDVAHRISDTVVIWALSRSARVGGLIGLGLFLVSLALTRNVSGWIALIAGTIPLLRAADRAE